MRKARVYCVCVTGVVAGVVVSAALASTAANVVQPLVSGELVRNGSAEAGGAASGSSTTVAPTGWKTTGNFTAVKYGAGGGFPDAAASSAISGGKQFFAGGPPGAAASATQVVPVPAAFRKAGLKVTAKLSAALGGYSSQLDDASVTVTFLNTAGSPLGTLAIKPVSHSRRGDATKLVGGTSTKPLPAGTMSIKVVIKARPLSGGYDDGYADNVSLHLITG
jgi:hypothetical protein